MLLLKLTGELDHHNAEKMRKKLDKEILQSGAQEIVFDLSELAFMDSSGIGVLLGRYKLFATRNLYLWGATDTIHRLLTMSGVYTLMPQYKGDVEK